jgi:hypothetical protein
MGQNQMVTALTVKTLSKPGLYRAAEGRSVRQAARSDGGLGAVVRVTGARLLLGLSTFVHPRQIVLIGQKLDKNDKTARRRFVSP